MRLAVSAAIAVLLAGCGGHSQRLDDGRWYGKAISVDVGHRQLEFAPACKRSAGRWVAVRDRARVTLVLAEDPDLAIYFRPGGDASAGHGQRADLHELADVVTRGRRPDFPPGWFVTVRGGAADSVVEDSGIRSSGKADKRTFACIWSKDAQAFVGR